MPVTVPVGLFARGSIRVRTPMADETARPAFAASTAGLCCLSRYDDVDRLRSRLGVACTCSARHSPSQRADGVVEVLALRASAV